jgi:transposase
MPKGVSQRAELAPLVCEMRQTMKLREISEKLQIPISTISEWCADPYRVKHKARRSKYAGSCTRCGKQTDGSAGPGLAPMLCRDCNSDDRAAESKAIKDICRSEIEALWSEGYSIAEIADMLGWRYKSMGSFIVKMRREGANLPYRKLASPEGRDRQRLRGREQAKLLVELGRK